MKNRLLMVLISLLCFSMLVACGNTVDDATKEQYATQAEEVVQLLVAGDYQTLITQFDAPMKEQLTEDKLAQITPLIEAAGQYVGIKKSTVQQKDGYFVTVVVAEFSNKNHIVTVSYNSSNEISGLFIK